ncbi:unnamed protein product, partial [Rotaria sp. Silwood1]
MSLYLMAVASLERYILIFWSHYFHRTILRRQLIHYIPLLFVITLPVFWYAALLLFYVCPPEAEFNYNYFVCGGACYQSSKIWATIDWILMSLLPVLSITIINVLLLTQVFWQKRRVRQALTWRKTRKMIIQLSATVFLYLITQLPLAILSIIGLLNEMSEDKSWLNLQFDDADQKVIKKPDQIQIDTKYNEPLINEDDIVDRIKGSMFGLALGDALGAHVEFRPQSYLAANPVTDLTGGGTWGLEKGQFTDDTSMALCLANSLIACGNFVPYDQLVRYKWWYRYGYMSSTGHCFDIGAATKNAIQEFEKRQRKFAKYWNISYEEMDNTLSSELLQAFDVNCSKEGVAGNGALMRLAPVPLFFYRIPEKAVEYSGESGRITHGDDKAYDACRYYGALIVAALRGALKDELISDKFYEDHKQWFGKKPLHTDILKIAQGSYKKSGGYNEGIRGKGYVVSALEAALWAFWSDNNSFEKGALKAVNLGDDTDTTAAIYGQLAGAVYGYQNLPNKWCKRVYAKNFICHVSNWIVCEG